MSSHKILHSESQRSIYLRGRASIKKKANKQKEKQNKGTSAVVRNYIFHLHIFFLVNAYNYTPL